MAVAEITPEQARAELERRRATGAGRTKPSQQVTPEQARAELERRRSGQRAAPKEMSVSDIASSLPFPEGYGQGPEQPAAPEPGNPVSRAFGTLAQQPGIEGGAASAALRMAQGIAEAPIKTLIVDPLTAPARTAAGINDANSALMRGDLREAGTQAINAGTAGLESALVFGAPGAGAAARSGARQAGTTLVPKPTETAVKRLMEADPNIATAAQNARRLNAEGIPATTADLASRNAQSRLKGAARRDGPAQDLAQDALDPRAADQPARLTRTIEDAFGVEGDFLGRVKSIREAKQQAATPLYEEAYATPTKLTPKLTELVNRPPLQQALRDADSLAAIDGVRLNKTPGTVPAVQVRSASGATRLEGDTAKLHYMRRALDDQIEAYRDQTTGKLSGAPRAQALVRLRKQFNEAIREANPAFAKADAVWSEGTAVEQAMERGLKASSMRTERQVRQLMEDAIREGDQEFFELGFAQGLIEKVGGSGSDMANRTLRLLSPENQKITRTVLGDERGEALLNRLRVENLMSRTRNRISPNVGSDSAENLQQTAAQAVAMIADVLRNNAVGAGMQALRIAGQKKLTERMVRTQREVDEQLIRLATEDPDELIRLIHEVQQKGAPRSAREIANDLLAPAQGPAASIAATSVEDQSARQARQ